MVQGTSMSVILEGCLSDGGLCTMVQGTSMSVILEGCCLIEILINLDCAIISFQF